MKVFERHPDITEEPSQKAEEKKEEKLHQPDCWSDIPVHDNALAMVAKKYGAVEAGLNPRQIKYAAYLAVPRKKRPCRKKIAEEFEISTRSLDTWKHNPDIISLSLQFAKLYLSRAIPEIYQALTGRAIAYSDRSADIILRSLGEIEAPGITINNTTNKLTITKGDLDDVLSSLRNLEKPAPKKESVILLAQKCS